MTTIFDVARRASVSITTVSHVFSGKGTIAAATRARVLDAARELNYAPSKVGTALATGRTFTIALLLPNPLDLCLVNPAFGEMVLTVTEECSAADYSVQVFGVSEGAVNRALRRAVERKSVDGIIWIDPPDHDDELAQFLRESGLPLVVGGRPARDDLMVHVRNDRRQVAALILDHLTILGRREIVFIAGPRHLMYVHDYLIALDQVAASYGEPPSLDTFSTVSWTMQDGRAAMEQLLRRRCPPTAIIGMNEPVAIGALHAAREHGLAIPHDLAVVSLGNSPLAGHFSPGITAVDVNTREIARQLVLVMLDLIGGRRPPSTATIVPASLVVRDSSGGDATRG